MLVVVVVVVDQEVDVAIEHMDTQHTWRTLTRFCDIPLATRWRQPPNSRCKLNRFDLSLPTRVLFATPKEAV
jgi:hypothetical protein